MTTEIILTRLFSVIVWHHFAFFAISVALFGTGVASFLVYLRQRRLPPEQTEDLLARFGVALAFSIIAVDIILLNVAPDWFGDFGINPYTAITFRLLALFVITATPFFFGGMALSLAMTRYAPQVHRLYFWDLFGAGVGCLVVIPALDLLGGPLALLVSAFIAGLAAALFSLSSLYSGRKILNLVSVAAMVAALVVGSLNSAVHWLDIRVAKGIDLTVYKPEYNRWNSFSMVSVFGNYKLAGWGLSPLYWASIPQQKTLVIDMNALTPIIRFDGSLSKVNQVFFDLSALVYRLRPEPEHVCIIGAGGGKDVLAALTAKAKHVTGVEINPLIVEEVMKQKYREFSGGLYLRNDVSIHVADGRSFIRRTAQRFDVILLSMVDTSAATAAGAYALTENGLYTSNAFRDYLSRLKPGGILSVSTVSLTGLSSGARLAALAREALLSLGSDPARSVLIAQAEWAQVHRGILHDVLIKPGGFSRAEIDEFRNAVALLYFIPGYVPGYPYSMRNLEQYWITQILTVRDDATLAKEMDGWPLDVTSVDDSRPFFGYQNRLRYILPALLSQTGSEHLFGNGLMILAKVALVAFFMVGLFLLGPAILARGELREGTGRLLWDLAYVSCLGMGFMFLEIALIQRLMLFLGNPTYALTVVLFVLLVFGGIGSRLLARRAADGSTRHLLILLAALIAYTLLVGATLGVIFDQTRSWEPLGRAALTASIMAPIGLLLGVPFPAALRVVARRAGGRIPWLWSVNSATSVLGSVIATVTSLHAGIPVTLAAGVLLYGCAAVLWFGIKRA
ncbi:MAG: hypothetical protein JXA30_09790 [Deltaproteobacteria bacterium]|nr:hypothetical protein [Deltaproteobacteria bacterium]